MDLAQQVLAAGGLFAPGFIAMRLIYTFGAQRQRLQWEWITWSVLLSLPIKALADGLTPWVTSWAPVLTTFPEDGRDAIIRIALALVLAVVVILAWYVIKHNDTKFSVWLRRVMTDSAFDDVLDDAVIHERWVWVVMLSHEEFVGWLVTAGREDSAAQPWMYLEDVRHRSKAARKWKPMEIRGVLLHVDRIDRIALLNNAGRSDKPTEKELADAGAASSEDSGSESSDEVGSVTPDGASAGAAPYRGNP